ncbi:RNA polymerase sigma-70 factor [Pedobacter yulinensis]|uniref:RNA polymerase sigma-70 factor n=1 Tax=Pedobacter yulinensis TaxID=2126353 RepID=A0A2T3HMN1_9SPHI|nr:RNA polymerase sigma-70 factor [Pedobacter yulinensis]PST83700.1 RNA polymerase sigma-70 factor [Pedobacter yulinensis]
MSLQPTSISTMSLLCDAELVTLWQQGTAEAFDVLYLRHVTGLVALAARKTGDRELAKEMVQDIFLDFFRRKSELDPEKSVKAYLYSAVQHRVYNYYREVLMRKKHEDGIARLWSAAATGTEQDLARRELEKAIQTGVNNLPEKCREVFVLSRQEHLPHKEIATRLNISVNTVEQHMRKALQRLRGSLQHYLPVVAVWTVGWFE